MKKRRTEKTVPYLILTILSVIFILPLLWVVLASFDSNAMQSLKLPLNWTIGNYREVLTNQANLRGFAIGL